MLFEYFYELKKANEDVVYETSRNFKEFTHCMNGVYKNKQEDDGWTVWREDTTTGEKTIIVDSGFSNKTHKLEVL